MELKPTGPQTAHNWQKDFDEYLKILHTGLRDRLRSTRQLFRDWDRDVFGQSQSQLGGGLGAGAAIDAREAALDAALDKLAAEESETEDEFEEEQDE